ncbi:MAG: hypothetical protein ACJ76H_15390 [Bacteriovoracaceae bacterium]
MKILITFFILTLAANVFAGEDLHCYMTDSNSCAQWSTVDRHVHTVIINNNFLSGEYSYHLAKEGQSTLVYLDDKVLGQLTGKVSEFGEGELQVAPNVSVKKKVKKLDKVSSCSRNAMNFCYKYTWYKAEVTTTLNIGEWSDTKVTNEDVDQSARLAFCCH